MGNLDVYVSLNWFYRTTWALAFVLKTVEVGTLASACVLYTSLKFRPSTRLVPIHIAVDDN